MSLAVMMIFLAILQPSSRTVSANVEINMKIYNANSVLQNKEVIVHQSKTGLWCMLLDLE